MLRFLSSLSVIFSTTASLASDNFSQFLNADIREFLKNSRVELSNPFIVCNFISWNVIEKGSFSDYSCSSLLSATIRFYIYVSIWCLRVELSRSFFTMSFQAWLSHSSTITLLSSECLPEMVERWELIVLSILISLSNFFMVIFRSLLSSSHYFSFRRSVAFNLRS